jgi:hypothetical protein
MEGRGDTLEAIGRNVRRLEKALPVQFRAPAPDCLRSHNAAEEGDRSPPEKAKPSAAKQEEHSLWQ